MDEVLDVVRSSLSKPLFLPVETEEDQNILPSRIGQDSQEDRQGWEMGVDGDAGDEDQFDDMGAGAGVEGDLEMGDDDDRD